MALPRWLAQVNKHIFNKIELRRRERPVLVHAGRSSGRTYETPLDAHPVDDGFIFFVNYGPESDWVKNVQAAGTADLRYQGQTLRLASPRLLSEEAAFRQLPPTTKRPPAYLNVTEYLRMDRTAPAGSPGVEPDDGP